MAGKLTKKQWLDLVDEFEQNNETQPGFAKNKGLNIATFRYWLYKVRRRRNKQAIETTDVEFVEVRQGPSSSSEAFRIRAGTMTLEFDSLPPASWIAELIRESSSRTYVC